MTRAAGKAKAAAEDNYGTQVPRVVRRCDACGQEDDHPRHVTSAAAKHPITGQDIDLSVEQHVDCCRDNGCHDKSCDTILAHAGDKRGQDLIDHLHEHKAALEKLHDKQRDANVAAFLAANPFQAGE